jgi:hypothetical protein
MRSREPKGPDQPPIESFNFRCSRDMARELIREAKNAGGLRQYIARLMRLSGVRNVTDWDVAETPRYRSFD